jgi:hypothetical protein
MKIRVATRNNALRIVAWMAKEGAACMYVCLKGRHYILIEG